MIGLAGCLVVSLAGGLATGSVVALAVGLLSVLVFLVINRPSRSSINSFSNTD